MGRLTLATLLLAALTGCAPSLLAAHREHVAQASSERVPLRLRVVGGNMRVVVPGRLGDAPVTWAIDTGAGDHSLTRAQARRRGLLGSGDSAYTIDFTGATVVGAATKPMTVAVFAGPPPPPRPLNTSHNPDFEAAEIAGFISPQRLVSNGGAVELDLARGQLLELGAAAATRAQAEVAESGAPLTAWCAGSNCDLRTVLAAVDGEPVTLLVDTGSAITALYADSEAGIGATMRATARVALDDSTDAALAPDAVVRVAGATVRIRRLGLVPRLAGGLDGIDGVLGLDVLRGCTLVLDAAGGAIACEAQRRDVDTAPALARPQVITLTPPLPAHAPALAAGVAARLGCETVTEAEVTAWARERGLPLDEGREAAVRARALAHVVTTWGFAIADAIPDHEVERHIAAVRAEHNVPDQAAFEAQLAGLGLTPQAYQAEVRELLLERWVAHRLLPPEERPPDAAAAGERGSVAAMDALVTHMRDRLARVPVVRDGARCEERWPNFYLEHIALTGLAPEDERAVRLAIGRWLGGRSLVLDAPGVLPQGFVSAVASVFAPRGLRARLTPREEVGALRITVALSPTEEHPAMETPR